MTILQAENLRVTYPGRTSPVLDGIDLSIDAGQVVALVGVNGCGKSTLLGALGGTLRPASGQILVDGRALSSLSRRGLARSIALVHQSLPPVPGITVRALVEQGRYCHRGPLGLLAASNDAVGRAAVIDALEAVGLADRAEHELDALSGGQRQRARLAVALAQASEVLLLDEPTAHLDARHQLLLLDLVLRLREQRGLTVVVVLHDLDQAARYADRVVVVDGGRVAADGPPGAVITPGLLADVFGVHGRVTSGRVVIDSPCPPTTSATHR